MSLSGRDLHLRLMPRSREENQERAFIAASRRKDRSLDARVKSANRASSLHKRRTSRAFHITKEIVKEEGVYEEVDERYQVKRILILQNQTLQIKEQFYRHLLAGFLGRPKLHSKGPSIASRRVSNLAFHLSTRGNLQKLSLDLSSINSSSSLSVAALIPVTISAIPFFCDELREDAQLRETNICTSLEYRDYLILADPCLGPYGYRFGAKVAAVDTAPSPGAYPHRRPVAAVQGMPPICPRVTSVAPGSAPVLTLLGSISRPASVFHTHSLVG
ncbi:hypothetical protein N7497_012254 [Penicillium chrysogenum]|nr:hypothetical protein N7497_012254 [Penicillium chrysogenum]